jgi:hypothetical protein
MQSNREDGIGVWQVSDYDWVAATSLDEALSWYKTTTGLTDDEVGEGEEVSDLDSFIITDVETQIGYDVEKKRPIYATHTARDSIKDKFAEGGTFPFIIASTEY